jgi:hypothetical protein
VTVTVFEGRYVYHCPVCWAWQIDHEANQMDAEFVRQQLGDHIDSHFPESSC